MGYYTNYSLDTSDLQVDFHAAAISAVAGYQDTFEGECTWCDHEDVMTAYSTNYPEVLFRLFGSGESNGDIWVKWFKAGEMQSWHLEIRTPQSPPLPWADEQPSREAK